MTSMDAAILEALLDEQHPRKLEASTWATENLRDPDLVERDASCTFWFEGWQKLAAAGHLGLIADSEYGGGGMSLIDALLTYEGLGHGCTDDGLIFACTSQALTMQLTLERFGTEVQRKDWLPALIAGEAFGAFAMSEPESGSDAFSLTTTATPVDGGWRLDGTKTWVTLGPIADVIIVFATTDRALGRWGITTFVVPADTPGLTIGPNMAKMGMRTTPFSTVTFDGCAVPDEARMGAVGAGASIFSAAMEPERGFLLVGNLGALERVIDTTVEYARTRQQFDTPIGAFQGVSHAIAEAKLGHEAARLLLYKAAALQQRGTPSMLVAAMSKLASSEAALKGALTSIDVHGARGYVTEFEVERDLRNAAGGVIYGGASGIQKNIIARLLGLPT